MRIKLKIKIMARVNCDAVLDAIKRKLEMAFEDTVKGKLIEGENAGYLSSDFLRLLHAKVDRWITVADHDIESA